MFDQQYQWYFIISSTCKHPIIALVATKVETSQGGLEGIVSESRDFIKQQAEKHEKSKVFLHSEVIQIPVEPSMEAPAGVKGLLANLGTHFNEKRGALVPLNWEDYSMFLIWIVKIFFFLISVFVSS